MLFDLQTDPGEINNRYEDSEYESVKNELEEIYQQWDKNVSDEGKKMLENTEK